MEPRRVDEEDDGRDHDLAEPAEDEEQGRENDPPEAELGQSHGVRKVEHVPREPEDQRAQQHRRGECRECDHKPARDERADSEDAEEETHAVESSKGLVAKVRFVSTATVQLLTWIAEQNRSRAETVEVWKTSCPRLAVWEDALVDGLVRIERGSVVLTDAGRELLPTQAR